VFLILTALVILNLVATICLMQSDVYTATEKGLQFVLVWAIPLVGATFVLTIWAHDRKSAPRDPMRHSEGPWLPGIGPESENRHHDHNLGDAGHGQKGTAAMRAARATEHYKPFDRGRTEKLRLMYSRSCIVTQVRKEATCIRIWL
jgi:hypothetical protein